MRLSHQCKHHDRLLVEFYLTRILFLTHILCLTHIVPYFLTSSAPQPQIKLYLPADIAGGVALRAEEDGFWSRAVSSMISRLLYCSGYGRGNTSVDEYFFQDAWSGPTRLQDKVLLFFGDPLQLVDVPWAPTTLVQNWTVSA